MNGYGYMKSIFEQNDDNFSDFDDWIDFKKLQKCPGDFGLSETKSLKHNCGSVDACRQCWQDALFMEVDKSE